MLLNVNLGTITDGVFYQDTEYLTEHARSNKPRVLVSCAIDGDDAADDIIVSLLANGYKIAEVHNTGTDGVIDGEDFTPIYGFIPPKAELQIKAVGTSADAVYIAMVIVEA